jgi:hypothetical protein
MSLIVLLEVTAVILVFVLSTEAETFARNTVFTAIASYRDDADLQGLLDAAQIGLQCCGFDSSGDWDRNVYFKCGSRALEQCGVPFSCCKMVSCHTSHNKVNKILRAETGVWGLDQMLRVGPGVRCRGRV